jgi:RNA polymerase sigma-70 factor (family 1)
MITQIRYSSAKQTQKFYGPDRISGEQSLDDLFQEVVHHDDYHAFEKIFNRTYKTLCQLSSRMVKSRELAEEIVDDVFCGFWTNRKKILISTSFNAYLTTSVRNRSLDSLRKMKADKSLELESAIDIPCKQEIALETMVFQELNTSVESAIASLPRQCRTIFLLSRDQGLMYKEIAELLQISIKTVDTQMGRALKHLRSVLRPAA